MNLIFALTAILSVMQGGETVQYLTHDRHCDRLVRVLSEEMPEADVTCIARSMRPIARPVDLLAEREAS